MQNPKEARPANLFRSRAVAVILVLALILAWLILDRTGNANPLRDAASRVLAPLQFTLRQGIGPIRRLTSEFQRVRQLGADNEALREENATLHSQIVLLREAQIENETLREQLDFKSAMPQFQLLSAEVIGRDPNNLLHYLIIDRGAADGLELGMPVVTAQGLVGRISEVSRNWAKVMLVTDPSSSVSALIQRSRATGIVQGSLGNTLTMHYIPQGDTVEPGDMVLTSGLGANFPTRLVIGQISSVEYKDVQMFKEAVVVPVVNLSALEVVMVMLNFTPVELSQETPTP
jgi:rod shape-determining protein MreC